MKNINKLDLMRVTGLFTIMVLLIMALGANAFKNTTLLEGVTNNQALAGTNHVAVIRKDDTGLNFEVEAMQINNIESRDPSQPFEIPGVKILGIDEELIEDNKIAIRYSVEINGEEEEVQFSRELLVQYQSELPDRIIRLEIFTQALSFQLGDADPVIHPTTIITYEVTTPDYVVSLLTQINLEAKTVGSSFKITPRNEILSLEIMVSEYEMTLEQYFKDIAWSVQQLARMYSQLVGKERGLSLHYANLAMEITYFMELFGQKAPNSLVKANIETAYTFVRDRCIICFGWICVNGCSIVCGVIAGLGTAACVILLGSACIGMFGVCLPLAPVAGVICAAAAAGVCLPVCDEVLVCH